MNQIQTIDIIDPSSTLVSRSAAWVKVLYQKAEQLIWQEYEPEAVEFAPWKGLTKEELAYDAIDGLPIEKRQANIEYQELVDNKAVEIAESATEAIRAALAAIIANKRRKRLKWAVVNGYGDAKELAKRTVDIPDNSTGRQIASFIDNHSDVLEWAGVPEQDMLEILSRSDKMVVNTSRAISRVEHDPDMTESEKKDMVRDVVEKAKTAQYASEVSREFLNGNVSIPRDIVRLDGETLVTFVCSNEEEFSLLNRRTEDISVSWGNAQFVLAESQAARTRQETITHVNLVLGLVQAGVFTLEEINEHIKSDVSDILTMLEYCGIIERCEDGFFRLST